MTKIHLLYIPRKKGLVLRCCHHRKCWSLVVEKHVSIIIHIASHHMIPRILRTDPVVCPDCNMRNCRKYRVYAAFSAFGFLSMSKDNIWTPFLSCGQTIGSCRDISPINPKALWAVSKTPTGWLRVHNTRTHYIWGIIIRKLGSTC